MSGTRYAGPGRAVGPIVETQHRQTLAPGRSVLVGSGEVPNDLQVTCRLPEFTLNVVTTRVAPFRHSSALCLPRPAIAAIEPRNFVDAA